MSEIKELMEHIERLKDYLNKLIDIKNTDLLDEEVLKASILLDEAIVKYNELIKNTLDGNK